MLSLNDIKNVLVVGAGTMGHSIAQVYAQNGFNVVLTDLSQEALDRAKNNIESNLSTLLEAKKITNEMVSDALNHLELSTNLSEFAPNAQLIIEAVNEDPAIKEKVFLQIADLCPEDTILASNTSGLNIYRIAKKIKIPSRLIIHHWFAPPHIIPLVEIVPGRKTPRELIDLSVTLMEKLGKKGIVLNKFQDLFIVNKLQFAIASAVFDLLLKDVATPEDIDLAVKYSLGVRLPIVGVAQTFDFTGLDVLSLVLKSKGLELSLLQQKIEKGDLGVKTGKGLYDYKGKSESEVLKARDHKYLQMLDFLKKIDAFSPIE